VAGYTKSFGAGWSDIWILKLNESGYITNCSLGEDSSAVVDDTTASFSDTAVLPSPTLVQPQDTSTTPQDSDASVEQICY